LISLGVAAIIIDVDLCWEREMATATGERLPLTLEVVRERLKLTQQQVAERVGTFQGEISLIENGNKLPSPDLLRRLARVLRVGTGQRGGAIQIRDLLRPWEDVVREGKEL